ncbi:hypothetical protein GPU89_38695 [Burkholderia cepacia]|nr:hypothetical protein [Burkholderia cepacia]
MPRASFPPRFAASFASSCLYGAGLMLGLALAVPAAAQTTVSAPRVVSELKDIRMKPLANLPMAGSANDRGDCSQLVIQPKSAAARLVAAQGWAVMSDMPLGPYRAISFAGQMEAATSGTCSITQGNVAVFENGRLIALAYGKSAEDTAIGRLAPLESGAVRIWDGDIALARRRPARRPRRHAAPVQGGRRRRRMPRPREGAQRLQHADRQGPQGTDRQRVESGARRRQRRAAAVRPGQARHCRDRVLRGHRLAFATSATRALPAS